MKRFNAKILLFGEYAILNGAKALVTPFHIFSGGFSKSKPSREEIQLQMKFFSYLKSIEEDLKYFQFSFDKFQEEIKFGVSFDSNIPQSYGVGSSGALVATIFDRYALNKSNHDFDILKSIFSKMESFFHGESSGLDPLCSYTNKSIIVNQGVKEVTIDLKLKSYQFFLIDTEQIGDTAPLVKLFKEKIEDLSFRNKIQSQLIPSSDKCIEYIINKEEEKLYKEFCNLSQLEIDFLPEMIPNEFKPIWQEGIDSKDFALKLCGSGGGGYLLGIKKKDVVFNNINTTSIF